MNKTIQCNICSIYLRSLTNTHLKTHGITQAEYKKLYPDAIFRTIDSIEASVKHARGKTYEEIYGVEKAAELKKIRSEKAKKQMSDSEQVLIRRIKCGLPEYYTSERKQNMSIAASSPELISRRNGTRIRNAELGKYNVHMFGRQSVQALLFIKNYLAEHNISESMCYFHKGGITGNEYYQVVYDPIANKKRTIAYDLVITNDGKHDIDTIIEINGPWHYRLDEVIADPESKSCPLKTNKYTKKESYNIDALKINRALDLCKNVYIFWLDTKELVKIKKSIKLLE